MHRGLEELPPWEQWASGRAARPPLVQPQKKKSTCGFFARPVRRKRNSIASHAQSKRSARNLLLMSRLAARVARGSQQMTEVSAIK